MRILKMTYLAQIPSNETERIEEKAETIQAHSADRESSVKLTEISGKQADNYRIVLESLGYSTDLDRFNVDSRGYSPELGSEFGDDYLDNRVIIASEKQLKDISLAGQDNPHYMEKVVSGIPEGIIKAITPYEAVTGYVDLRYGADSLIGLFDDGFKGFNSEFNNLHASLSLDTLEGDIRKICSSQDKVKTLTKTLRYLDKNLLEEILTETHSLTTKYGSIEHINNVTTHINISQDYMKKIFQFKHKGNNLFIFNCQNPFLIYTGEKNIKDNKPIKILHESNKDGIMDYMVKNQLLEVKKETVAAMMESTAKTIINKREQGATQLTGFQFYKEFNKLKDSTDVAEDLKAEGWHILRDYYFDRIEFSTLPIELKAKIVTPKESAEDDDFENDQSSRLLANIWKLQKMKQ